MNTKQRRLLSVIAGCVLFTQSVVFTSCSSEWETVLENLKNPSSSSSSSIEEHDHQYDWVVTKEPTCFEEGEQTSTCSICGQAQNSVPIPKVAHNRVEIWGENVFEENGNLYVYFTQGCQFNCSEYHLTQQKFLLLPQVNKANNQDGTCTQDDIKYYLAVYENEGKSIVKEYIHTIKAPGHTLTTCKEEDIKMYPSFTQEGVATAVCDVCQQEVNVVLPFLDEPEYSSYIVKPFKFCSEPAIRRYTYHYTEGLSNMVVSFEVADPVSEHTFGEWQESSDGSGISVRFCDTCGYSDTKASNT